MERIVLCSFVLQTYISAVTRFTDLLSGSSQVTSEDRVPIQLKLFLFLSLYIL